MSFVSDKMRLLAGTAAVVVFNSAVVPSALASGDTVAPHPLLGADGATYMFKLSKTLVETTGDVTASNRTRGFTKALEDKLRAGPRAGPQMVTYPQEFTPNMLVVGAVIPPATLFATASIPFCADQNMAIVYKGHITVKGDIIPDTSASAIPISATSGERPCRGWLIGQGNSMRQMVQPPDKADNAGRPAASLPAK